MNTQTFQTIIESGPESFGAFAPDIQGCIAFSVSREDLKSLFKLAVESHVRELVEAGEQLPLPETTGIPGLTIGVQSGSITLEWTTVMLPVAAQVAHA